MTNKDRYIDFCEQRSDLPLYLRPLWLDCISCEWDVLLIEEEKSNIIAAMPYTIIRDRGIVQIRNFTHTKYCGIYVESSISKKPYKTYSRNKKVLNVMAKKINELSIDYVSIALSPKITDWTPLYRLGFFQKTYYTYKILYQEDFNNILMNMGTKVRNNLKNKSNLTIKRDAYGERELYQQIVGSFKKQGRRTGLTEAFIGKIYKTLKLHNQATIFTAEDEDKRIHGAVCFVWDQETLYYEFAGEDPELRSSNSLTLLIVEGIKLAHEKKLDFDFDIGMNEGFTDFAARFGAIPIPYFEISKITSKNILKRILLKLFLYWKS